MTSTDRITLLTCSDTILLTKRHHMRASGGWKTDPYDSARHYSARVVEVDSAESMERLLRSLETRPRTCIVRDLPRDGVDRRRMVRRRETMAAQPVGLRMIGVDIEEIQFADFGIPDPSGSDRGELEHAARIIADDVLPEGMEGCRVYYQWSSSAGVKGWSEVRLHLWLFLDRPIFRGSLKEWGKGAWGVDQSLYDSVRVHYTAAPVFLDHRGDRLPDLLGELRSGVLDGPPPVAPEAWVDRPTWERVQAEEEARARAKREASRAAQNAAMGSAVGRDRYKRRAHGLLRCIEEDLRNGMPDKGRHGFARAKIRKAFGVRGVLRAATIVRRIREAAIIGLMSPRGGQPDRSESVATGEVDRLINELVDDPHWADPVRSKAPPIPLGSGEGFDTTMDHAPGAYELDEEGYLSPLLERIRGEYPEGLPWDAPEEGWGGTTEPVSLDEGRAWLDRTILSSVSPDAHGYAFGVRRIGIAAPAGSGKSYAAKRRALIETTAEGGQAVLVVPTLSLASEAVDDLNSMAAEYAERGALREGWFAAVATTRRAATGNLPATCYHVEDVAEASRLAPNGGALYCRGCPHHPRNGDDPCPLFKARRREGAAAVVVKTHALAVLEGDLDEEEEEGALRAMVIDEDPSPSMTSTGSLSASDLLRLVASRDLDASDDALGGLLAMLARSEAGERFSTSELRERVDASALSVGEQYLDGDGVLEEAFELDAWASPGEETEARAHLRTGVPWRTIAGLREAVEGDWGASTVSGGRLWVSHTLPLCLDRAETVIYLDATASEARTRALLGEDALFARLSVDWPEEARVEWVPIDCGVRSRLHVEGARRVPSIWAAALSRYGGEGSLLVTSKRNRDPDTWTGQVCSQLERAGGAVIHHRGADGRGVNRYRDRSTVLVDPWHVPTHAIDACAWSWCRLSGGDWTEEDVRESWQREARAQLLGAEVLQEIARIRPLSASEEDPKRIVILDRRDPRSLGLPLSEVIDPDRLAWSELGIETGVDTAPSILRAVVDSVGGVWCPSADLQTGVVPGYAPRGGELLSGLDVERQRGITDVLRLALKITATTGNAAAIVRHWITNHGGAEDLSARARVPMIWVENDRGRPRAVFCTVRLHRTHLDTILRPLGVSRYRPHGVESWVEVEGVPSSLRAALVHVLPEDAEDPGRVVEVLAARMSVSTSTVRREVRRLSSPDHTFSEALGSLLIEALSEVALRASQNPDNPRGVEMVAELSRRVRAFSGGARALSVGMRDAKKKSAKRSAESPRETGNSAPNHDGRFRAMNG